MADSCVWIRTTPDLDGIYWVVLEIDDDTSHPLPVASAMVHARAVLAAVARAEYDAAVVRQMTKVGKAGDKDHRHAATLVGMMRNDRPPIEWPSPLALEPGVSAFTGDPFLHVMIRGRIVGQWTIPDARDHAIGVLEAVEAAYLDGGYLRALRTAGIDDPQARAVVDNLATHRPEAVRG